MESTTSSDEPIPSQAWEGVSGVAPTCTRLEVSMLEDYMLVHEVFSKLIFLANTNELLVEPRVIVPRKMINCFIRVSLLTYKFSYSGILYTFLLLKDLLW